MKRLLILAALVGSPARAESQFNDFSEMPARQVAGYSFIAGGGLLTWIGVFAGFAGKSPCEREANDQDRSDCYEKEHRDAKKAERVRLGMVGVGLASMGIGVWLVQ